MLTGRQRQAGQPLSPPAMLAKALGTLCWHCLRLNLYWRVAGRSNPRCYYCTELLDLSREFGDHMYEQAVVGVPVVVRVVDP